MKDEELTANFSVLVSYYGGKYLVEITDSKDIGGMNIGEARDESFHKAIEEAFSCIALNDTDYIEASL